MKKVCTYLAVLGMMLTMIPNLAAPAASAYSQAAVTVQADSQEKTVYKDVTDAPATSVSVAALNGKWVYDDVDITFSDGTVTAGKFTMDHVDGTKDTGTVKLQYTENAKGEKDYFFVLYNSDGKLNLVFKVNGTIPLEELYTAGEGSSVKFVRVKDASVYKDVTDAPATSVSVAALNGKWVYDDVDITFSEGTVTSGKFTMDHVDGTKDTGTVKLQYTENAKGEKDYFFVLYNSDGKLNLVFKVNGTLPLEELYTAGDGSSVKFVRVKDASVYKDVTDAPATSVSVSALNGKWVYDDVDITFSDGTVTSGKFTMDHVDGTKDTGTVKLQYTENAKGEKDYFFVLYNSDGKLNLVFKVNGTIPLEALYTAGEGSSVKFVRVKDASVYKDVTDAPATSVSVAALNGKWVYDDVDITFSEGTVTSGKFTMDHVDGTKDTGTVKLQYTENAKGEKDYFFVLYNSDGKLNLVFKVNGTIPLEELYTAGEGSSVKFVRAKEAVKGDVTGDGAVSVEDAQLALTAYVADMAGLATGLSEQQTASGDINGDKKISVEDAQLILLYYVKNTVSGTPTTWEDLLK